MAKLREVEGTYGGSKTPSTIYIYENRDGSSWYVAEGSVNVNMTYDSIEEGVDIEMLSDADTASASKPINSLDDLEKFMDDEEYGKGGKTGDKKDLPTWNYTAGAEWSPNQVLQEFREQAKKKGIELTYEDEFSLMTEAKEQAKVSQIDTDSIIDMLGEYFPTDEMSKGGKVTSKDLLDRLKAGEKISENEVLLIKNRMNNNRKDEHSEELEQWIWDNQPELTPEQNKKGLDFLMNLWKSPTGKERSGNPFREREQKALETFEHFTLDGFYDASRGGRSFYIPIYGLYGSGGNFQYYYDGKVNIISAKGGVMEKGGKVGDCYNRYRNLLFKKYKVKDESALINKINDQEDMVLDKLSGKDSKTDDYDKYELSLFEKYNVTTHTELYNKITDEEDKHLDSLVGEMEKGGKAGKPRISYVKHWHPTEGTVYTQTVRIDKRTYDHLRDAVASEIAMGYPQKDKYVWTSGYEFYLKPLTLDGKNLDISYLNHTQQRFINMFLKLPLKDRNTRLKIADKLEKGGNIKSNTMNNFWNYFSNDGALITDGGYFNTNSSVEKKGLGGLLIGLGLGAVGGYVYRDKITKTKEDAKWKVMSAVDRLAKGGKAGKDKTDLSAQEEQGIRWHLTSNILPAPSDKNIDKIIGMINGVRSGEQLLTDTIGETTVTIAEMIDDLKLEDYIPQEVYDRTPMGKGGSASGRARDRKYTSQQEHELKYAGKRKSEILQYNKHEKGGEASGIARDRKYTSQEEHELTYKPHRKSRVRYYQKGEE